MHGVQPIANTAPRVKDAPYPPRPLVSLFPIRPPTPASAGASDIPPVVAVRPAEAPASSGRHVPFEDRDPEDAGEAQPHDHEDRPADDSQRPDVLGDCATCEGCGDAEQGKHGAEARNVDQGVPHRGPARRRDTELGNPPPRRTAGQGTREPAAARRATGTRSGPPASRPGTCSRPSRGGRSVEGFCGTGGASPRSLRARAPGRQRPPPGS